VAVAFKLDLTADVIVKVLLGKIMAGYCIGILSVVFDPVVYQDQALFFAAFGKNNTQNNIRTWGNRSRFSEKKMGNGGTLARN